MKMAVCALVLAIVLGSCASIESKTPTVTPEAGPPELTPSGIRAMIARDGAVATVAALVGDGGEGNAFLSVGDAISKGDQAWLDVVPLLAPGADAAATDVFTMALSIALPHNPAGVLRLIDASRPVARVCANRLMDPSPPDSALFKKSAIGALGTVRDPALAKVRRECLASLRRR